MKLTPEVQKPLDELRLNIARLREKTLDIVVAGFDDTLTVEHVDAAIDAWNAIINSAPQALRRAKGAALGYKCPTCGELICVHKENQFGRKL